MSSCSEQKEDEKAKKISTSPAFPLQRTLCEVEVHGPRLVREKREISKLAVLNFFG